MMIDMFAIMVVTDIPDFPDNYDISDYSFIY